MFRITITFVAMLTCLVGCSSGNYVPPVNDREPPPGTRLTTHTVAQGETLYSIAWRYNLGFQALADANGIDSDYAIYPGQRLNLTLPTTAYTPKVSLEATPPTVSPVVPSVTSTPSPAPVVVIDKHSASKERSIKTTPEVVKNVVKSGETKSLEWVWPARGNIIATFSSNGGLNKGIDLHGNLGESVLAAAAGKVVYSGAGLRGYGKLLIVKHSDKLLSAYAHNRRLLVKEGDEVASGQKIAEMGSSGTETVKLHFEIRYDGKPVDPLKYLPRR
ncbi:peptidoglycan DD-metalloendopeptidase family protein [Teredinibacter waterburyi]|uniref:peptidoglycan DD-metalloendopeptidase family protein n=1 Tax=Teredinibacter waterburyi TaxID=1500538 RepID=UPI003CCBF658